MKPSHMMCDTISLAVSILRPDFCVHFLTALVPPCQCTLSAATLHCHSARDYFAGPSRYHMAVHCCYPWMHPSSMQCRQCYNVAWFIMNTDSMIKNGSSCSHKAIPCPCTLNLARIVSRVWMASYVCVLGPTYTACGRTVTEWHFSTHCSALPH